LKSDQDVVIVAVSRPVASAEETALVDRGLLGVREKSSGQVVHPSTLWGSGADEPRVITPLGKLLASVMRLDLISDPELEGWAEFDLRRR
jgi:hypothetical protein